MHFIWAAQSGITYAAVLGLLAVKVYAFVDAAVRPAQAYVAASKMTKPAWLLILGLSAVTALMSPPLGFLSILGTVASFVYLLDARPALREVTRRR